MARILVLGASGYIGSHLVPLLVDEGHAVRAAARRLEVLEARAWAGVELVQCDAQEPEDLRRALSDIDVAYYLVHSMGSGSGFAAKDRKAATAFREAAAEAGVARIVYLGGLQPGSGASTHLKSRGETGDILREGPVPVVELRAGLIVGAGSAGFEVIRDLVNHLPAMVTPRWVNSRTQPIALDDVLGYLVRLAVTPEADGRCLDVGGPEVITYREMLEQFGDVTGKRVRMIGVPVLSPRLSSYWLDLVTSVPAQVARPLIDGLKSDLVGDTSAIREMIPITLHSYRDAIRAALRDERERPLAARWTEGSLAMRSYNAEASFYSKGTRTEEAVNAPAAVLWEVVRRIGGGQGYYHADRLWEMRGLLDRVVGGVGMRRGRRHRTDIRVGDAIDFWRVAGIDPGRRITLVAEMKLPGSAVLEFEVLDDGPGRSRLVMTSRFHPYGVWGLLYWFALIPLHNYIFGVTPKKMARAAERRYAGEAWRVAPGTA